MSDLGHDMTDEELSDLEKRIADEYKKAADDLADTIDAYFEALEERDKKMRALLEKGKITEQEYTQWRLAQIGRGKRFEALRDQMAERYTKANEVAAAYINDTTPGIYTLNYNFSAYTIEKQAGDVGFNLLDEQTVRRLIVDRPDSMPYYPPERAVRRGIDLAYGKRQITAQVTQGILQGLSVPHIADKLQKDIPNMERVSAVRAARTAITGAQNAGRMASYKAAKDMGIKLKRKWLATLDNRTRHEHRILDGQKAEEDEPFKVNGEEIMFPGDPNAAPHLVYNCRCTLIAEVDGVEDKNVKRRAIDPKTGESVLIEDMTYSEWEAMKKKEDPEAWAIFQKKGANASADKKQYAEYKKILGKNAPKTFEKFQDLKYNDIDGWARLKTMKRQTVFVEGAPCITTPKKYTGYFLKPGSKHSNEFFSVGYTQNDALQLRYDMAKQFDIDKAFDFSKNTKGEEKFSIYMELGIDEKRTFQTVWQKDTPDSEPRIITAHRKDPDDD